MKTFCYRVKWRGFGQHYTTTISILRWCLPTIAFLHRTKCYRIMILLSCSYETQTFNTIIWHHHVINAFNLTADTIVVKKMVFKGFRELVHVLHNYRDHKKTMQCFIKIMQYANHPERNIIHHKVHLESHTKHRQILHLRRIEPRIAEWFTDYYITGRIVDNTQTRFPNIQADFFQCILHIFNITNIMFCQWQQGENATLQWTITVNGEALNMRKIVKQNKLTVTEKIMMNKVKWLLSVTEQFNLMQYKIFIMISQ